MPKPHLSCRRRCNLVKYKASNSILITPYHRSISCFFSTRPATCLRLSRPSELSAMRVSLNLYFSPRHALTFPLLPPSYNHGLIYTFPTAYHRQLSEATSLHCPCLYSFCDPSMGCRVHSKATGVKSQDPNFIGVVIGVRSFRFGILEG